jgi:hypothetical protein
MQIEKFNKANLTQLRAKMNALLKESGFENVEFNVGNIKFSENDCKITVEAKIAGKQTAAEKRGNAILQSIVASRGLQMKNAQGFELVDYMPRRWKMPFIYTMPNGKRYKCDETQAIALFGKK